MKNVIMILCDTLRANSLPHYGSSRNTIPGLSPIIDNDFVVYERAYAPAPWTVPSHLSLFTGLYPSQVMETKTSFNLNASFVTLAEIFKEAGYRTTAFVSNELISKKFGFDRGFENFNQMWLPDPKEDDMYLDLGARGDIERVKKLLLMLFSLNDINRLPKGLKQKLYKRFRNDIFRDSTFATHKTFKLLKKDLYENRDKMSFYFLNLMQTHEKYSPPACVRNVFVKNRREHESYYKDRKYVDHYAAKKFSSDLLQYLELLYDQEILYLDLEIMSLINFLKDNKLYDGTTIVITSDHGEQFGDHGHYTHVFSVYESVIRIPLYIKWAGHEENQRKTNMAQVMLHDLYTTFLNMLNHWLPAPFSSISLHASDKRTWSVSQCPDMSHDIKACRQVRQSFSVEELGLEEDSLVAYVFNHGTKIIENGSNLSCYELTNDPGENNRLAVTDAQLNDIESIKKYLL